jgi:capsular polysaccharide biosynthesis protein
MISSPTTQLIRDRDQQLADNIDLFSFAQYALTRWKFIAKACFAAVTLAAIVSFLSPKNYTATASLVVQPPEGIDSRGALAVSSIYLESLKTYEHYAYSDSLFEAALIKMNLRSTYPGVPIEALKRRVLEINKPRDTKILEIRATLRDPKKAQQLAFFIAQQTTLMNRNMQAAVVHELTDATGAVVSTAKQRLDRALQARDAYLQQQPIAALESDLSSATELKTRVDRDLIDARVERAAYGARATAQTNAAEQNDSETVAGSLRAVEAEVRTLESQSQDLQRRIASDVALVERRKRNRETLDKEVQIAQAQFEAENAKKNEVLASAPSHGERLEIVDPGVVPERPSSPKISLNLAIALLASIGLSLLYLAIAFNFSRSPGWNHRFPKL